MIQEAAEDFLEAPSRASGPLSGANGDLFTKDDSSPPNLRRSLGEAIHILDAKTSLALLFVSAIWKFPCFHRSASIPLKADAALDAATPSSGAVRHPSSPRHFFSLRSSLGFARASLTVLATTGSAALAGTRWRGTWRVAPPWAMSIARDDEHAGRTVIGPAGIFIARDTKAPQTPPVCGAFLVRITVAGASCCPWRNRRCGLTPRWRSRSRRIRRSHGRGRRSRSLRPRQPPRHPRTSRRSRRQRRRPALSGPP